MLFQVYEPTVVNERKFDNGIDDIRMAALMSIMKCGMSDLLMRQTKSLKSEPNTAKWFVISLADQFPLDGNTLLPTWLSYKSWNITNCSKVCLENAYWQQKSRRKCSRRSFLDRMERIYSPKLLRVTKCRYSIPTLNRNNRQCNGAMQVHRNWRN